MGRYVLSVPFAYPYTTANLPMAEIYTQAACRPRLVEFELMSSTPSAIQLGIGRPAAVGITPTRIYTPMTEDFDSPATTLRVATEWATPPTPPAIYLRRLTSAPLSGSSGRWVFRNGIVIPISSSLVIYNVGGNNSQFMNFVFDL